MKKTCGHPWVDENDDVRQISHVFLVHDLIDEGYRDDVSPGTATRKPSGECSFDAGGTSRPMSASGSV